MQTDDNSCTVKRLVKRPLCMFCQVTNLTWNGLIIRRLWIRVPPSERTPMDCLSAVDRVADWADGHLGHPP